MLKETKKMLIIITGGSGSGKSEYAEAAAIHLRCLTKANRLIYIAAMKPYGSDAVFRIERHRALRKGKGFETIEKYTDIRNADVDGGSVVLIECISNLTANEMFDENSKNAVDDIAGGITELSKKCLAVIAVTNNVFCDGIEYDGETMEYMQNLAHINNILCGNADIVTEVVCGIPTAVKGEQLCLNV